MIIFLLDKGLKVDHGMELLWSVAKQALEITHESVHVPANGTYYIVDVQG